MKSQWMRRITPFCLLTLMACSAGMDESLYVQKTESSDPIVSRARQGGTLSQRVPNPKERVTLSQRLIGSVDRNGEALAEARFGTPYRSRYGNQADTRALKQKGIIDVAVEVDLRGGIPVYRFVLTPQRSIERQHVERWAPVARVSITFQRGRSFSLLAPLPEGPRLRNGQVITPWVHCDDCLINDQPHGDLEEGEYYRLYQARIRWLSQGAGLGRPLESVTGLRLHPADAVEIRNLGVAAMVVGDAAAESARQASIEDYAAYEARVEQARLANRAYTFFIDSKYAPLTMRQQFRRSDCPKYHNDANTNQNAEYNRTLIEDNRAFIRCARRVVDGYHFEAYIAAHPDLVEREQRLWEKTYGIERETIDDVEGQLQFARDAINGAYEGIDNILDYVKVKEEQYAREQRQHAMTMAALDDFSRNFASMMADMRDQQVVVYPDGRVTTISEVREHAIEQGRMQAYRDAQPATGKDEAPTKPAASTPGAEPSSPPASAASAPNRVDSAAAASTGPSAPAEPAGTPVAQAGGPAPAPPQTGQAAREAEPPRPADNKQATQVARPQAVEPHSGGVNGCVALLQVKRHPGKSPLSSCSYTEPERLSTEFTFRNQCEFPVHITIDIDYDDGVSKAGREYDVKPGRVRSTVPYCGLSDYAYHYEETRESVRQRSQ